MDKPVPEGQMHPAWQEFMRRLRRRTTRRQFMSRAALSAGGVALSMLPGCGGSGAVPRQFRSSGSSGDQASSPSNTPIRHVVILCQENRSFDHYFGPSRARSAPVPARPSASIPPQLTYTNSAGTPYHPFRMTQFCVLDPDHSWDGSHESGTTGEMNGWVTDQKGDDRCDRLLRGGRSPLPREAGAGLHARRPQLLLADGTDAAEPHVPVVGHQRLGLPHPCPGLEHAAFREPGLHGPPPTAPGRPWRTCSMR